MASHLYLVPRATGLTLATLVCGATLLSAQSPSTPQLVTVVVMPFEFAAPLPAAAQRTMPPQRSTWPLIPAPRSTWPLVPPTRLAHGPTRGSASYPNDGPGRSAEDAIGVGIADLLVERLLDMPGVRVIERRRLDLLVNEHQLAGRDTTARLDTTILRARYIITGSVTRFGTEERRGIGGLGGAFGLGALGLKRPKTHVALTARVIDAITGEIVMSVTAKGISTKGGGIVIGGLGGGIGGGVAITSSEFRESALGEATQRAIEALSGELAAKRDRLQ